MSERLYKPGRGPRQHKGTNVLDLGSVSQAKRTAKSQVNDGVLRWKLRWSLVLIVFFTAHGYGKGVQMHGAMTCQDFFFFLQTTYTLYINYSYH